MRHERVAKMCVALALALDRTLAPRQVPSRRVVHSTMRYGMATGFPISNRDSTVQVPFVVPLRAFTRLFRAHYALPTEYNSSRIYHGYSLFFWGTFLFAALVQMSARAAVYASVLLFYVHKTQFVHVHKAFPILTIANRARKLCPHPASRSLRERISTKPLNQSHLTEPQGKVSCFALVVASVNHGGFVEVRLGTPTHRCGAVPPLAVRRR